MESNNILSKPLPALPLNPGAVPTTNHVQSVMGGQSPSQALAALHAKNKTDNQVVPAAPPPQHVEAPPDITIPGTHPHSEASGKPPPTPPEAPIPPVPPGFKPPGTEVTPPAQTETKPPASAAPVDPEVDPDLSDDIPVNQPAPTLVQNLRNVRKKYGAAKEEVKKITSDLEAARQSLEKYQKGEVLPDTLKALTDRVAYLEHFEKVYNLESSPEYIEKSNSINGIKTQLNTIGKDYGLEEGELEGLLEIKSVAERNRYLDERFDGVGATQVVQLLDQAKAIKGELDEFKKEPEKALTRLAEEGKQRDAQRRAEANQRITSKVRNAWSQSIQRIQSEGWATELIERPNDTEHNEKYVRPIVAKAAEEHGKIISQLVAAGLNDIPEELSDALATQSLLSHAAAVAIESRNTILKAYNILEANTKRTSGYTRPSFGGSNGGGTPTAVSSPSQGMTPQSMAVQLRQSVMKGQ